MVDHAPPTRPATQLLDRKLNDTVVDPECERETHFAKTGIHRFGPLLEALGIKRVHIPNENRMNQLPDDFALAFGD